MTVAMIREKSVSENLCFSDNGSPEEMRKPAKAGQNHAGSAVHADVNCESLLRRTIFRTAVGERNSCRAKFLAERAGFEPAVRLLGRTLA